MGYGSQSKTVQESVAPYFSVISSNGTTTYPVCRAIMNMDAASDFTLTFADGTEQSIHMLQGVLYPIAATKSPNGIRMFY